MKRPSELPSRRIGIWELEVFEQTFVDREHSVWLLNEPADLGGREDDLRLPGYERGHDERLVLLAVL